MIEIVKEKKSKKAKKPYYILKYEYMIGDANGSTSEKVRVSADNPFIERYVTLLNSLKATKGHWDVMLEYGRIEDHAKEKQITKDDLNFLNRVMFCDCDDEDSSEKNEYFKTDKENKFANEFADGVRSDTEYSFLVFQGVTLYYYDENGIKNNTKIKNTKIKK